MKIHLWNTDLLHCPWSLVASLSLSFPARLLLESFWYEDPSLDHWPPALSLRSRCIPLSFPSCSSPSVIFLIWRSISGTLTSCIILEVSLSLSLSLPARLLLWSFWYEEPSLEHWPLALSLKSRCISLFSFLLDSICNLSDMKAHFGNTDLLHDPWSLVASLSVNYARRLNIIFLETKPLLSRQICRFFHYLIRITFVITKRCRYLNKLSLRRKSHESVSRNLNFTISRTEQRYHILLTRFHELSCQITIKRSKFLKSSLYESAVLEVDLLTLDQNTTVQIILISNEIVEQNSSSKKVIDNLIGKLFKDLYRFETARQTFLTSDDH